MQQNVNEKAEQIKNKVLDSCNYAAMTNEQLEEAILRCIDEEFQDTYITIG